MKKLFAILLVVTMLASMATVVSAAETTTLTTTVPAATYTLNIPADQEIPFGTTKTNIGNITVTDSDGFALGKDLKVTVAYDVFSAEGINTTIPYSLTLFAESPNNSTREAKQEIPSGSTFLFEGKSDGSVNKNVQLSTTYSGSYGGAGGTTMIPVTEIQFSALSTDWGKALGGNYTTTITFTAEVVVE